MIKISVLLMSRAPRERILLAVVAALVVAAAYVWLILAANHGRERLRTSLTVLRAQDQIMQRQTAEIESLRSAPKPASGHSDLPALMRKLAESHGLGTALNTVDGPNANEVRTVFGSVAYARWLLWLSDLQAQGVRLDTCRIEALFATDTVNVSATLRRDSLQ